ncbi:MAG: DsbA family protein [Methylotenera sp.]|nr:DsbA family protein [Oligoflexia bacterium]
MQKVDSRKKYLSFTLSTTVTTVVIFAIVAACTNQQAKAKPNFVYKDAPSAGVVAKIGDQNISDAELIGEDKLEFFELKKREYDLRMDRLNKLIEERLVGAEAKKAKMTLPEFMEKKVIGGDIKISDKDYKKFVAEKKIPESQINPQIKERINAYLQNQKKQEKVQAYVAKLTKGSPVEVYFTKPKMDVKVEVGEAPTMGPKDAKVTIIEFSDFQCPFCSRGADVVHEIKKKYGNKVQIAFKNFPLPMHKDAIPAAEAAQCVKDQSADKFWKFHDLAFKSQDKLDAASLEKYAKDAGADVAKFKECQAAGKSKALVQADMAYGEKVGVKSTPTFFVNGQIVSGAVPIENFSEIIDEELEAKKM